MEQKKNEFLDSKAKLRNYENAAKTYLKYYRLKRSVEFLKQADKEEAWKRIQRKRAQRTFRRQVQTLGKVAAAMAACFALTYFATHYGEVKVEKEANKELRAEYSFPETGGKKALLKTDNGEVIDLTTQNGTIRTSEHTVAVSKAGESLSYAEGGKPAEKQGQPSKAEVHYNTLQVPRGGEYQLVLEDGTKVWLNAESSLRYPTTLSQGREVTLEGEAYFEVAKNEQLPFVVRLGDNRIEVLGTKFNVSAYPGNNLCATLVEGSVKVNSAAASVTLHPDEQATVSSEGHIGVRKVDASLFMAWTQGRYEFRQTELEDIARQLSRWYDVDIRFDDENLKHRRFAGAIFRNNELEFAIEVIEKVSDVKFVRQDNNIHITQ